MCVSHSNGLCVSVTVGGRGGGVSVTVAGVCIGHCSWGVSVTLMVCVCRSLCGGGVGGCQSL